MNRSRFLKTVAGTVEPLRPSGKAPDAEGMGRPRPARLVQGIANPEDLRVRQCSGHILRLPPEDRNDRGAAVTTKGRTRAFADERAHAVASAIRPEHEPLEVRGLVHGLTRAVLHVLTRHGEVRLTIDQNTIVVIDGEVATPGELVIGETVKVDALPMPDRSLRALLVVAEVEELELVGSILCLTDGALTLETATEIVDVGLTEDTVVLVVGHEGSLADLRVGMHVEVTAERVGERLWALVVKMEDDFDLVELAGVIVSVGLTELVLLTSRGAEVVLASTPHTFVMQQGELAPWSALQAGGHVTVKAYREPGEALIALRIRMVEPVPEPCAGAGTGCERIQPKEAGN